MVADGSACPYGIGDTVVFTPSDRTRGLYQDIERFGVRVGEANVIIEVRDGTYLYFSGGAGGWPWNEFALVSERNEENGR